MHDGIFLIWLDYVFAEGTVFANKCVYDVLLVNLLICFAFDLVADLQLRLQLMLIRYVEVADFILGIVDAIHNFEVTELLALALFSFGHIRISSF